MTGSFPPPGAGQWLNRTGPDEDVVVSSRVRLARNVAGFPFLPRISATQQAELLERCRDCIGRTGTGLGMNWVDLSRSSEIDRQLLAERSLISRLHCVGDRPRGVAISDNESVALMVNEEDHLRLQVLQPGLQLASAFDTASELDDLLEAKLDYAYSPSLGYLTACPTNVGTGLRVSVMLHLPALVMTGEIEKLRRAAADMNLAVRGFQGEGSESLGDLFQISNQTTLGVTERQVLEEMAGVIVPRILDYERKSRQALLDERTHALDDKLWRAWGVLSSARLIGGQEAIAMLSLLRMGIAMGRLNTGKVTLATVNQLLVLIQPAHLQKLAGQGLDGPRRKVFRAELLRQKMQA